MFLFNLKKNYNKEFIKNVESKNFKPSLGPKYVVIDITNRCNLNCIACWTYSPLLKDKKPEERWFRQELSFDTIKKLIYDLKKMQTEEIRLTGGGEPFLHPDILDIIKLIKKSRMKLDITTNFTLVNKEKIDILIKNNVDNITVSLWAGTAENYLKTHPNQKENSFYKITDNLKYLNKKKKSTKVVIANVISNLNYTEIEKMADYAYITGTDEIYFTFVDTIKDATDKLLLTKKQKQVFKKKFLKVLENKKKGKYGSLSIDNPDNFLRRLENEGMEFGLYDSNIIYEVPCTVGWTFSRILANGDVAPCCRGVMIPSGNINKDRFFKIWVSLRQQSFRKIGMELNKHPKFIEKVGCIKSCDNIMHNTENYGILKAHTK